MNKHFLSYFSFLLQNICQVFKFFIFILTPPLRKNKKLNFGRLLAGGITYLLTHCETNCVIHLHFLTC